MATPFLHGYGPAILQGLASTLTVAASSLAISCVFGLLGAVLKLYGPRPARIAADTYTTLIRGLPDLVLMLFVFYGGQIAINKIADSQGWGYIEINPFLAGVLTLGFIFGAYLTETFRGDFGYPQRTDRSSTSLWPFACSCDQPHRDSANDSPCDSGLYEQLARDG
jgi:His/Glu/Gln/Arg/opine family amino acid ABC transporter permease subunit